MTQNRWVEARAPLTGKAGGRVEGRTGKEVFRIAQSGKMRDKLKHQSRIKSDPFTQNSRPTGVEVRSLGSEVVLLGRLTRIHRVKSHPPFRAADREKRQRPPRGPRGLLA